MMNREGFPQRFHPDRRPMGAWGERGPHLRGHRQGHIRVAEPSVLVVAETRDFREPPVARVCCPCACLMACMGPGLAVRN